MKRILVLLLAAFMLWGCASGDEEQAQVIRVIDGDTIEIAGGARVRYIGIDTPEVYPQVEPYGLEAWAKNRELVENKVVRLEKDVSDTDRYGRLLRYVYVDGLFVNGELVRLGYAKAHAYPPDVRYQELLSQLDEEARETGRGMWQTPTPMPTAAEVSNIQITYIFYDGLVPRVESDEYVEIANLGVTSQDLAGWVLSDACEGYPSFTFPAYILNPGEKIRVYTNEYHPEWGGFSFGFGRAIWNNTVPDVAVLYDAQGQEVSRKSY